MRDRKSSLLACASALTIAVSAFSAAAYAEQATRQSQGAAASELEEVVVSARRKEENLQDVPETVNVVTAEQVQKYNILNMLDVQKLVPGLILHDGSGFDQTASMRGVTYNQVQAAPDTVAFYMNDVNLRALQVFQGFYDIGQVEVARGPQGTVRGKTAPSGTVTLTTRRPDLENLGGYVEGSLATLDGSNFQGAVGMPIVPGKFALRVSILRDENSLNGVRSVFNPTKPKEVSKAARLTALFQPVDDLRAVVVYQHLRRTDINYASGVYGNGSPGVPGDAFAPAGFNGPPIGFNDLLTNASSPAVADLDADMVSAQVDWNFGHQRLSYVGGYNTFTTDDPLCVQQTFSAPFPCFGQINHSTETDWTHELRLTSAQPAFGKLDYTLGYFFTQNVVPTTVRLAPTFLAGAFGSPLAPPRPGVPNYAFDVQGTLNTNPNKVKENALYGSLTYHFTQNTEITGGLRWSKYFHTIQTDITFDPATIALPLPAATCGAIGGTFGATYPGVCNLPVVVAPLHVLYADEPHPVVYNVEFSHRFNDQLMAYAKAASAFRASNISLGLAVSTDNPQLAQYLFPKNEKSKSYEIGAKADLFDKRLQLDFDVYHQTYDGLFYNTLPTYYKKTLGQSTPSVSTVAFTTNVPAIIDGVELTANARITRNWSAGGSLSWADGRLDNALIPCNSSTFNGVIDNIAPTVAQFNAAGVSVATCRSKASTSTDPKWNVTAQSEYDLPLSDSLTGFTRGLLVYRARNPNANTTYEVPGYGILDLYFGLRGTNSKWELTAYGKNITNNETATTVGATDLWANGLDGFFGTHTGYFNVNHVSRRQFGLTVHYTFGAG
jgi:iron complex outermembrane receptor protein